MFTQYLPIPFLTSTSYGLDILAKQISIELLAWSHIAPALFGIAFSIFLYKQSKKLSAFYLLLLSSAFAIWSYLDLNSWSGSVNGLMFTWSILDMFSILFTIFTLWFLYAFLTEKDLPPLYKWLSVTPALPPVLYTLFGLNLNTYYAPEQVALEANATLFYIPLTQTIFLFIIILLGILSFRKSKKTNTKRKIFFGTIGASLFISIFITFFLITNVYLYFFTYSSYVYNISVYALFGMPFLIAFLGYLIAKYQAFDLKLSKSIGLIVVLMGLLFLNIFI
jgi:hypothetical protein